MIPPTVKFTIYGGDASNIDMGELQQFVNDVDRGRERVNLDRTFQIDEIEKATDIWKKTALLENLWF